MIKKYFLEGADLEWFKKNYPHLGSKACQKKLKHLNLPTFFLSKMAEKYKLRVTPKRISEFRSINGLKLGETKQKERNEKANAITIQTAKEAYVLGLLWGDGSLHTTKGTIACYPYVAMQIEDFDVIKDTLKSCFGKWNISYRQRENRKKQGEAFLFDSSVGLFLKNNDYTSKSIMSPTKILSQINLDIQHFFWRGYCDADGCFYTHKERRLTQFSLAGSYEQDWQDFVNLLNKLDVRYKIARRSYIRKNGKLNQSSIVVISNRNDICKLGKYLYEGNIDIGLSRKFEKYKEIEALNLITQERKRSPND